MPDEKPGEEIPTLGVVEPIKRGRGRPPGSKTKKADAAPKEPEKATAKMPIPKEVAELVGGIPFLLAGQVYGLRAKTKGRQLSFAPPPPGDPFPMAQDAAYRSHTMAMEAARVWLETAAEAPAWLVFVVASSSAIAASIMHDQVLLKIELAQLERAKIQHAHGAKSEERGAVNGFREPIPQPDPIPVGEDAARNN